MRVLPTGSVGGPGYLSSEHLFRLGGIPVVLDASLGKILDLIDEHGWAVGGGNCDCGGFYGGADDGIEFSYTVGMSTLGFPEVITYGLPQRVAQACLNRIGQQVSAGKPHRVGAMVDRVFQGLRATCSTRPIPPTWSSSARCTQKLLQRN